MSLHWLSYKTSKGISVVILEADSLALAKIRAGHVGLDEGEFTEGHELPAGWAAPHGLASRRLTVNEAERVLKVWEQMAKSDP